MTKKLNRKVSFIVALVVLLSSFFGTTAFAEAYTTIGSHDLISNGTFDNGVGLPWQVVTSDPATATFDISGGTYKVTVKNPGTNRWDIQFRHRGLVIEQGHNYTVKFTVTATKDCSIRPRIGDIGQPYIEYWNYNQKYELIQLKANVPQTIIQEFTMDRPTAKTCEFAFQLGGDLVAASSLPTLVFDDINLIDPDYITPPISEEQEPTNGIRVNQEGYFPNLSKVATLVSRSTSPVAWKLVNSGGTTVAQGMSTVKGFDHASGDNVHIIDFSSYRTGGAGYKLIVASSDAASMPSESLPFDIRKDLYTTMKYNAMKYFYHNRSGIAIEMPYADSNELTRAAGHPSDVLAPDPTKDYRANYTLDVTGGWYDGGDYGKYVVNGGIATWTIMNEYERALYLGDTTAAPFADNTLNIPESGNGSPDILDESRWNLQTLLNMQVPAGNTLAGMVHHKAGDEHWALLALAPTDNVLRFLQPPSTNATLNLAAIAAQGSRLWKEYDSAFATKCLTAAETAWDAAIAHPAVFGPIPQSAGEYAYSYLNENFYWAACELYVTTGSVKYLDYIKSSEYYLQMPTELVSIDGNTLTGCFDASNTAGLGTISLALVPNNLPTADVATAKSNIKLAADKFIAIANSQGYGVPIEESILNDSGLVGFPWGSNSFVVNEAICMSYAYEFSDISGKRDTKYLSGVAGAMDYILGRNPNVQSYVTGYGDNPLENPHHRFWAFQADNSFPKAPAGCLSGGPNSGLQDPWVRGSGWSVGSRAPEKCFMDNIESWSTNEITMSSNAPLAWVSAYLDEQAIEMPPPEPPYGDVNDDKVVDALDYALVKSYLLGKITDFPVADDLWAADVNGDNAIDALDYALFKMYLLKTITVFPKQ